MPRAKKNTKFGRPEIKFTPKQWREFEDLCSFQCTKLEICAWFSITDKTLDKLIKEHYDSTFSEVFAQKRNKGKISLRRSQFQLAEKNPALSIWLGKQYLEQRDPDKEVSSGLDKSEIEELRKEAQRLMADQL